MGRREWESEAETGAVVESGAEAGAGTVAEAGAATVRDACGMSQFISMWQPPDAAEGCCATSIPQPSPSSLSLSLSLSLTAAGIGVAFAQPPLHLLLHLLLRLLHWYFGIWALSGGDEI